MFEQVHNDFERAMIDVLLDTIFEWKSLPVHDYRDCEYYKYHKSDSFAGGVFFRIFHNEEVQQYSEEPLIDLSQLNGLSIRACLKHPLTSSCPGMYVSILEMFHNVTTSCSVNKVSLDQYLRTLTRKLLKYEQTGFVLVLGIILEWALIKTTNLGEIGYEHRCRIEHMVRSGFGIDI